MQPSTPTPMATGRSEWRTELQSGFSVKKNQTRFSQRVPLLPALALSGGFTKGRRETVNCVLRGAKPQACGLCTPASHSLLRVSPAWHRTPSHDPAVRRARRRPRPAACKSLLEAPRLLFLLPPCLEKDFFFNKPS